MKYIVAAIKHTIKHTCAEWSAFIPYDISFIRSVQGWGAKGNRDIRLYSMVKTDNFALEINRVTYEENIDHNIHPRDGETIV